MFRALFILLFFFGSFGLFAQETQKGLSKEEAVQKLSELTGDSSLDLEESLELVMKNIVENKIEFDERTLDILMGTEEEEGVYSFVSKHANSITEMAFVILVGGAISSSQTRLTRFYALTINSGYRSIGLTEGFVGADVSDLSTTKRSWTAKFNDFCLRVFGGMLQNRNYSDKPYSSIKL